MSAAPNEQTAGWFGKIPALGDFATRRLPASFVAPWDEWLSMQLSAAQLKLAETWEERYDRAPVMCFSLAEQTVDAQRWHGILVPSADRVGRRFPLTLAHAATGAMRSRPGEPWWSAVVAVGLLAVKSGCGVDELDERLRHLPACTEGTCGAIIASPERRLGAWWRWSSARDDVATAVIAQGLPGEAVFRELLHLA
jgi:type VI secretion system protein ImpM